jgi:hypothetical protein
MRGSAHPAYGRDGGPRDENCVSEAAGLTTAYLPAVGVNGPSKPAGQFAVRTPQRLRLVFDGDCFAEAGTGDSSPISSASFDRLYNARSDAAVNGSSAVRAAISS